MSIWNLIFGYVEDPKQELDDALALKEILISASGENTPDAKRIRERIDGLVRRLEAANCENAQLKNLAKQKSISSGANKILDKIESRILQKESEVANRRAKLRRQGLIQD